MCDLESMGGVGISDFLAGRKHPGVILLEHTYVRSDAMRSPVGASSAGVCVSRLQCRLAVEGAEGSHKPTSSHSWHRAVVRVPEPRWSVLLDRCRGKLIKLTTTLCSTHLCHPNNEIPPLMIEFHDVFICISAYENRG